MNLADPESELLGDAGAVLGEEAHIRSGRTTGPRNDPDYPHNVDSYANLILLCPTHHTLVDKDNGKGFSVQDLELIRAEHESAMQAQESPGDELARTVTERTAASIALWESRACLEEWQGLTWGLNSAVPAISTARLERLHECAEWLLAKDWPDQHPHVRQAFRHFLDALSALTQHVFTSFEPFGDNARRLRRAYKSIPWNPDLYQRLSREFGVDAMTTWILTVELSRAANLVISAVRRDVDPLYRFDEGVLLAREGDGIFANRSVRIEYASPWEGLGRIVSLDAIKALVSEKAEEEGVEPEELDPYSFNLRPDLPG